MPNQFSGTITQVVETKNTLVVEIKDALTGHHLDCAVPKERLTEEGLARLKRFLPVQLEEAGENDKALDSAIAAQDLSGILLQDRQITVTLEWELIVKAVAICGKTIFQLTREEIEAELRKSRGFSATPIPSAE